MTLIQGSDLIRSCFEGDDLQRGQATGGGVRRGSLVDGGQVSLAKDKVAGPGVFFNMREP